MIKDNMMKEVSAFVHAPINEKLSPQQRLQRCIELSDLITKMVTHVICHTIVDHEELLKGERLSVASAFLQRAMSTHLCNHKLTKEGISLKFQGEAFQLHEAFKTMTLTRSVYEHLVMFYFIFSHPRTDEERSVVWNYWKVNSMKNLLDYDADGNVAPGNGQEEACKEIEALRRDIFYTHVGMQCYKKLDEWTMLGKPTQNGSIAFFRRQGVQDVRRVSYNQAWKYLFRNSHEDMTQLYRLLSIHCHPIYNGLMEYQDQGQKDDGGDSVPLYFSCCFLAYLCRLFMRLLPNGHKMFDEDFSERERLIFKTLSEVGT